MTQSVTKNRRVQLKQPRHTTELQISLQTLLCSEPLWNVLVVCSDGPVSHNRLTAGLVFPQLTDQDTVVAPDFSKQELTELVNKALACYKVKEDEVSSDQTEERSSDEGVAAGLVRVKKSSGRLRRRLVTEHWDTRPESRSRRLLSDREEKVRKRSNSMESGQLQYSTTPRTQSGEQAVHNSFIKPLDCPDCPGQIPGQRILQAPKYATIGCLSFFCTRTFDFLPPADAECTVGSGRRRGRCMACSSCLQPDCLTCRYCVDMKKYGGPGVKKQSCENRPKCGGGADTESGGGKEEGDKGKLQQDFQPTFNGSQEYKVEKLRQQSSQCLHLKCGHCMFIAKTEAGLKRHAIRYHKAKQDASVSDEVSAGGQTVTDVVSDQPSGVKRCVDADQCRDKKQRKNYSTSESSKDDYGNE